MSNLQIALILLAIVVIAGVYGFNRWQEARYRKRAESAFKQRHDDVLMTDATPPPTPASRVRERIEPQFQGPAREPEVAPQAAASAPDKTMERLKQQASEGLRSERPSKSPETAAKRQAASETKSSFTERATSALVSGTAVDDEPIKIEPASLAEPPPANSPPGADQLDYQVDVVAATPIGNAALDKALRQLSDLATRVKLWGASEGHWHPLDMRAAPRYLRVRATMQLVTRAGMVNKDDLITFRRVFERCAAEVEGTLESAEIEPALESAQQLDRFCQDADVMLSLSVIAQKSGPFAGTKIRAWAEAAGFQLRQDGVFHISDEHGGTSLYMESHENPGFLPERIRTLSTNGVTLLLDVPRATNGLHAFDRLVTLARQLATSMGGVLVDDNRSVVSESGLDQIRQQLKKIYEEMDSRGMPAGSPLALRLFQ